ncbi:MAG: polysaccharide deacetylase family protein [Clostridia bacterium]|nr:polysaccharide deacetylase family protein [Clostridia bacterium]
MTNNFLCFPDGKLKALTFSYDDGPKEDRRLVALFNKYNVKGTFNLNSQWLKNREDNPNDEGIRASEVKELYKGHEVAVHGLTHPFLERLPVDKVAYEIVKDRENLEKFSDTIVRGMAYPFGTYNDNVVRVARDAGIRYSRTCHTHHSFKIDRDWLRMPSTCHQADEKLFELAEQFVNDSPLSNRWNIESWLFYVWGHSFEFRTEQDWERKESFLKIVANRDDVWYATNIEIYNYITAYDNLEYTYDGDKVYNPSATDVWLRTQQGKVFKIPAGETVILR